MQFDETNIKIQNFMIAKAYVSNKTAQIMQITCSKLSIMNSLNQNL